MTDAPNDYQQYLPVATQLWEEMFKEPWMSDADWQEVQQLIEQESKESPTTMARSLAVGVENGYSIETQLVLIRRSLRLVDKLVQEGPMPAPASMPLDLRLLHIKADEITGEITLDKLGKWDD